jgi:universal stress protein A
MTIQQILVPVDFSPSSEAVLKYASEFAQLVGARIHLVHVLDQHLSPVPEFGLGLAIPAWVEESRPEAEASLARLLSAASVSGPNVVMAVTHGSAAASIVDYAREHGIDLILLSTHGRTGVSHLVMGSVAEGVLRHAPCPVLTLRVGIDLS